jgi:hypothetical protein
LQHSQVHIGELAVFVWEATYEPPPAVPAPAPPPAPEPPVEAGPDPELLELQVRRTLPTSIDLRQRAWSSGILLRFQTAGTNDRH